ncbi:hypothetical protein JANAI62_03270 [Jannaschia pagri]|uniref:Uncharacterized protein n=1 Tax=Jannaschia pagri TaxID=2829797 RepID=A0ABQ4NHN1_9RHOB|nr:MULTISPECIES: hypothetical protein [unclassified Jannaschia]GIT90190.1 hypothetical protein JANAI61_06480 [Jannaschia sp. AI_61]GIT93704.1 hypothetical protein JANAI62_03270 [Jannaschia sp. AI_62]
MKSIGDILNENGSKITLKARYCTIYHPVRIELGLKVTEYVLCDGISKLSNRPGYEWCLESRENLGAYIGISLSTTKRHIATLIEKELLERNGADQLRATVKWYEAVEFYREKTGLR